MSSRLSTSAASRSREVSAAWSSSRRSSAARSRSRLSRVETDALAAASGVRKSWPTAASSAVRTLLASARGAASAAAWLSRMWSSTTAAWAAKAPIRRWSSACEQPSAEGEDEPVAGRHLGVGVAGPGDRRARRSRPVPSRRRSRSSSVTEVRAKVSRTRSSISDERLLAAQHAAGEVGQGARLGGRAGGLPGAPRRQVDRRADQRRHQDEDQQREGVVGLADGQRVQRRGEVVVEQEPNPATAAIRAGARPPTSATTTVSSRNRSMSLTRLSSPRNGVRARVSRGGSSDGEGVAPQLAPGAEAAAAVGQRHAPAGVAVGDDVDVDVAGLRAIVSAAVPGLNSRARRRATAVAEHQLGGVLGAGEGEQRLGHVVAEHLVVGPAERLDEQPLGGQGALAGAGESVGAGDVDGEQVAAAGPGRDACRSADERLALGAAGQRDDDPLAGLPGAGDVVLSPGTAGGRRRPGRRSTAARARAGR